VIRSPAFTPAFSAALSGSTSSTFTPSAASAIRTPISDPRPSSSMKSRFTRSSCCRACAIARESNAPKTDGPATIASTVSPASATRTPKSFNSFITFSHARGALSHLRGESTPTLAQGCPRSLSLGAAASRRFPPAGHPGASLGPQALIVQFRRIAGA